MSKDVITNKQLTSGETPSEDEWLHIKETIKILCLAVCQIETSVADSSRSVEELTQSFTELANRSDAFDESIQQQIAQAITAFQFYDRFSQRLDHVARSLETVTDVMTEKDRLNDPEEWQRIQERVRSSYTMESERLMFEHILRGASIQEALEIYRHHFNAEDAEPDDEDIELF